MHQREDAEKTAGEDAELLALSADRPKAFIREAFARSASRQCTPQVKGKGGLMLGQGIGSVGAFANPRRARDPSAGNFIGLDESRG